MVENRNVILNIRFDYMFNDWWLFIFNFFIYSGKNGMIKLNVVLVKK